MRSVIRLKSQLWLRLGIVLVCLSGAPLIAHEEPSSVDIQQILRTAATKAHEISGLLGKREFEVAYQSFGKQIQEKLPLDQLEKTWNLQVFVAGALKDVGEPRTASLEPMTFEVPVNYSLYSIIVRITLDDDLQVIGLFMRPSRGTSKDPEDLDRNGESEVTLKREGFTLVGTLRLPEDKEQAIPLVILLSGSGPTDRDGNQAGMRNDSLRRLARRLSHKEIATLRYDKRGSGVAIAVDENALRPTVFVKDVLAWVDKFKNDSRFGRIVVCGHSEGAFHGLLAIQHSNAVDGLVSLAGAGRNIRDVLQEQLAKQLSDSQMESAIKILDQLQAGKPVKDIPVLLQALFRESVQPYLIEWMQYDPATLVASSELPMLIVQGEQDIQITKQDAGRLAKARDGVQLILIPEMNHVLRRIEDPTLQTKSYTDPRLPIESKCVDAIADFVLAL